MLHTIDPSIDLDIWVDLTDKSFDGTVIKYKAQVYSMEYSLMQRKVILHVQVYPYSAMADGSFGQSLSNTPGFSAVSQTISARNFYLIDMSNGHIIADTDVFNKTDDQGNLIDPFAEGGDLYGKEVMGDYDFYRTMAATQPILLDQMIRNQVTVSSARGDI